MGGVVLFSLLVNINVRINSTPLEYKNIKQISDIDFGDKLILYLLVLHKVFLTGSRYKGKFIQNLNLTI